MATYHIGPAATSNSLFFAGIKSPRRKRTDTIESFSTNYFFRVIEDLRNQNNKKSTKNNYYNVWTNFNKFIIKLDYIPKKWEHKVAVYIGYLVDYKHLQSSTIKSYVSAIKSTLVNDGYPWDDKILLLSSITKGCKMKNDVLHTRLPIQHNLLNIILSHLEIKFRCQVYLECLYKTAYALAYHGLFRVGELTQGPHAIKSGDVHLAGNKQKYLFILHSSKTHTRSDLPQKVAINQLEEANNQRSKIKIYCPYQLTKMYIKLRPKCYNHNEQFLVYSDSTPLTPENFRNTLRSIVKDLNLNQNYYDTHSFRIGRATDLMKRGVPIDKIKEQGRWKSNAVYKYLR